MTGRSEDALYYLRNGEFDKAKAIFSRLLDNDPEDPHWITGFYISSFWDNKVDYLLRLREGRERGRSLLGYLDSFEKEIQNRNLEKDDSYEVASTCILEEITHHLGIAFRLEGWNGLESESIQGLASSHLRLGNFQKALDILEFRTDSKFRKPELSYLKADALMGLGRENEGMEIYLLCFMDDPTKLPVESIQWAPILKLYTDLRNRFPEDGMAKLLLPVYLWELNHIAPPKRQFNSQEVETWYDLILRMHKNTALHTGKYQIKTAIRNYYCSSVFCKMVSERNFSQEVGEVKKILAEAKSLVSDLLPG